MLLKLKSDMVSKKYSCLNFSKDIVLSYILVFDTFTSRMQNVSVCLCLKFGAPVVYQQQFLVEINVNSFEEGNEWVDELSCLNSSIYILHMFLSEITN
jgi:hypothetical protein